MALSKEKQLWALCRNFFQKYGISAPESIYQRDIVIENAYEFIEKIGEVIGAFKKEE